MFEHGTLRRNVTTMVCRARSRRSSIDIRPLSRRQSVRNLTPPRNPRQTGTNATRGPSSEARRRTYLLRRGVDGAVVRVQLVHRVPGVHRDGGCTVESVVVRGGGARRRQRREQQQQQEQQQRREQRRRRRGRRARCRRRGRRGGGRCDGPENSDGGAGGAADAGAAVVGGGGGGVGGV